MDTTPRIYRPERTALVFLDPYNDFLAEDGKLWPRLAEVAEATDLRANLKAVLAAVRATGIPVVIAPHHRSRPGDFEGWDHPTPYQLGAAQMKIFEQGSHGGEWHPDFAPRAGDIVASEHWTASGFAGTDLDYRLKQIGATHLIFVGLIANTCVEGTARAATDLGYHVTLVRDATAAFSPEAMHAAHEINAPSYAHAVLTSTDLITQLA
ncbi:isochorismatase family cysteine hydrolase [Marinibacterium profundimaris]|uniref:Isochorismatase n=1 Tax=Marinibacterium profundimaris TaxID=1679460 RepID=A0A225NJ34_9RHOB|nr:isochorismatase family cysteine hydrolase [Marinibacterium profundimaris]OWU73241.1 isochorismatase [Marinibacterium profundimaris]